MKKFILAASLAAFSAIGAFAQAAVDDYKKGEFYVGYSNGQVDTGLDSGNSVNSFFRDRANFNGVNVSGVYNFNRYVGAKGDFSATFNNTRFSEAIVIPGGTTTSTVSFNTKNSLYNLVGGVQVKDNANSGVFKPFARGREGSFSMILVVNNDPLYRVELAADAARFRRKLPVDQNIGDLPGRWRREIPDHWKFLAEDREGYGPLE